jgi:3'(2'), 5'-bisphosphate nucleotidase
MAIRDGAPTQWDHVEAGSRALDKLAVIARAAGRAAMVHYDHPVMELKDDRSPVTSADRAAHQVVTDALAAWDPVVPVISEEGRISRFLERRHWVRFWLVDPFDGTKEFVQRNGEFTVNIAGSTRASQWWAWCTHRP